MMCFLWKNVKLLLSHNLVLCLLHFTHKLFLLSTFTGENLVLYLNVLKNQVARNSQPNSSPPTGRRTGRMWNARWTSWGHFSISDYYSSTTPSMTAKRNSASYWNCKWGNNQHWGLLLEFSAKRIDSFLTIVTRALKPVIFLCSLF